MRTATQTPWWQRVATGVRVQMTLQKRTVLDLSRELNRAPSYVSIRLHGHKPFKMDEIESTAAWLDVTVESLASEVQV